MNNNIISNSKLCISKRNLVIGAVVFIGAVAIFFTNYINSQKVSTNSRAEAPITSYISITPVQIFEPTLGPNDTRRLVCINQKYVQNNTKVGLFVQSEGMPLPTGDMYLYRYNTEIGHTLFKSMHPDQIDPTGYQILTIDKSKFIKGAYYYSQIVVGPTQTIAVPTQYIQQQGQFGKVTPTPDMKFMNVCINNVY